MEIIYKLLSWSQKQKFTHAKDWISVITGLYVLITPFIIWPYLGYRNILSEGVASTITLASLSFTIFCIICTFVYKRTKVGKLYFKKMKYKIVRYLIIYPIVFTILSAKMSYYLDFNWNYLISFSYCTIIFFWISYPFFTYFFRRENYVNSIEYYSTLLPVMSYVFIFLLIFFAVWWPFNSIPTTNSGIQNRVISESRIAYKDKDEIYNYFDEDSIISLSWTKDDKDKKGKKNWKILDTTTFGKVSKGFTEIKSKKTFKKFGKKYIIHQNIADYYDIVRNSALDKEYWKVIPPSSILIREGDDHFETTIGISHNIYKNSNLFRRYAKRLVGAIQFGEPYNDSFDFGYKANNWQVWQLKIEPTYGSWKFKQFHGGLTREHALLWYKELKGKFKWRHLSGLPN